MGPLFDLLDVFTMRTRVDFAFLQHYLKTTIAETYSLQARRQARAQQRTSASQAALALSLCYNITCMLSCAQT